MTITVTSLFSAIGVENAGNSKEEVVKKRYLPVDGQPEFVELKAGVRVKLGHNDQDIHDKHLPSPIVPSDNREQVIDKLFTRLVNRKLNDEKNRRAIQDLWRGFRPPKGGRGAVLVHAQNAYNQKVDASVHERMLLYMARNILLAPSPMDFLYQPYQLILDQQFPLEVEALFPEDYYTDEQKAEVVLILQYVQLGLYSEWMGQAEIQSAWFWFTLRDIFTSPFYAGSEVVSSVWSLIKGVGAVLAAIPAALDVNNPGAAAASEASIDRNFTRFGESLGGFFYAFKILLVGMSNITRYGFSRVFSSQPSMQPGLSQFTWRPSTMGDLAMILPQPAPKYRQVDRPPELVKKEDIDSSSDDDDDAPAPIHDRGRGVGGGPSTRARSKSAERGSVPDLVKPKKAAKKKIDEPSRGSMPGLRTKNGDEEAAEALRKIREESARKAKEAEAKQKASTEAKGKQKATTQTPEETDRKASQDPEDRASRRKGRQGRPTMDGMAHKLRKEAAKAVKKVKRKLSPEEKKEQERLSGMKRGTRSFEDDELLKLLNQFDDENAEQLPAYAAPKPAPAAGSSADANDDSGSEDDTARVKKMPRSASGKSDDGDVSRTQSAKGRFKSRLRSLSGDKGLPRFKKSSSRDGDNDTTQDEEDAGAAASSPKTGGRARSRSAERGGVPLPKVTDDDQEEDERTNRDRPRQERQGSFFGLKRNKSQGDMGNVGGGGPAMPPRTNSRMGGQPGRTPSLFKGRAKRSQSSDSLSPEALAKIREEAGLNL